jgi:hypothetical protein
MSLAQGSPLPNITTTQGQTTTAPAWYTDYLSGLANTGNQAAQGAQYVGAQPLQNQAFNQVAQNVGNYQPNLMAATNLAGQAGGLSAASAANPYIQNAAAGSSLNAAQPYLNQASQNAYSNVNNYMSPYVNDVVNQIGALGQRQIQQSLAPQATAGIVGAGQFGSKRGAEALSQTIRDANQNILATQGQALNTGYQNAMQASQADLARQAQLGQTAGQLSSADLARMLSAGQTAGQMTTADMAGKLQASQQYGNLATQNQALGLGDVNALSTLGQQQQTIGQNQSLFPMQVANQQAGLLRGYTVPTSVNSTYTGPIPGAYAASPLQQIAGIGSLLGALNQSGANGAPSAMSNILSGITGGLSGLGTGLSNLFGSGSNTAAANDTMANVNMGIANPAGGATTSGGPLPGQTVDDYGNVLP